MQLSLFRTRWGAVGTLAEFSAEARSAGFDGIECPVPATPDGRAELELVLGQLDAGWIAEIVTGGDYVPRRDATLDEHVADLLARLDACATLDPVRVNCIGGLDAWSDDDVLRFFDAGMDRAAALGLELCFETHRSRCLFNPWRCEHILAARPELKVTADISHWCAVAERLMDTEMETIRAIAPRVRHIHARVGYDQGPQVPHPAAPEYAKALASHQRCWEVFWDAQRAAGVAHASMTPEFGPDGYLHLLPFTRAPVADLWEINRWMADTERRHFERWSAASADVPAGGDAMKPGVRDDVRVPGA